MMLDLKEDKTFYFDAAAADRPVRFFECHLKHFTGKRFAGRPFLLEPIQKQIVRDIYGWKYRATGFRRFTDVYWEGAVGAGKSPILAGMGLFGLVGDNEPGAQVYSFAATYPQARIVFETAKKFIKASPKLAAFLQVRHAEIRYPAKNAFWVIVSGDGPGAGANPHVSLGDEAHDWTSSEAYDDLNDRKTKRDQPMMVVATNSGTSQASFCWKLREKAVAALAGQGDPGLYPIIWAADENAKTDDRKAWRDANPLLGITMSEEKVAAKCVEMSKDEDEERKFRRLYLSVWPKKQADRWIDLAQWDSATARVHLPSPDLKVFVGGDLSQSDDLCAIVWARVTAECYWIDSHFWMPRVTAEKYDKAFNIGYQEWAKAGHITLLDEPTVSSNALLSIAAAVRQRCGKKQKPEAFCYDRYKADVCVKALEADNVPCVPIPQGHSITPGCNELDRRLKEGSIIITPNPVMRFCAENVVVKKDDHDNIVPVKPGAKGDYAGTRGKKIDGISALVTVLTQARKHAMPAKKVSTKVFAI